MTQVKELTGPGTVLFEDVKRYLNNKVIISVSNLVENVSIRIEEKVSSSTNPVNLDSLNRTFLLIEEGDEAYLLENQRIDKLQVNFVSGDAELKILYEGW